MVTVANSLDYADCDQAASQVLTQRHLTDLRLTVQSLTPETAGTQRPGLQPTPMVVSARDTNNNQEDNWRHASGHAPEDSAYVSLFKKLSGALHSHSLWGEAPAPVDKSLSSCSLRQPSKG